MHWRVAERLSDHDPVDVFCLKKIIEALVIGMKRVSLFSLYLFIVAVAVLGCGNTSTGPDNATVEERDGRLIIIDLTKKKWDVTHAKEKYGMEPAKFQFGLGPNAIRPIQNPVMVSGAEKGYPDDSETFLILGTTIRDETRAYPLSVMGWHEIANEDFRGAHVAAAY